MTLEGLNGIDMNADDILICGKDETITDAQRDNATNLIAFMECCSKKKHKTQSIKVLVQSYTSAVIRSLRLS